MFTLTFADLLNVVHAIIILNCILLFYSVFNLILPVRKISQLTTYQRINRLTHKAFDHLGEMNRFDCKEI